MEIITTITHCMKYLKLDKVDEETMKKRVLAIVKELLPDVAEDIISHTYDVVLYLAHNKKVLKGIKQTCKCI